MSEIFYGLDDSEILQESIREFLEQNYDLFSKGDILTIFHYERTEVDSSHNVECAFEVLIENLTEDYGTMDCDLLTDLDFESVKDGLTKYIDSTLVSWHCKKTGKTEKIKITSDHYDYESA